MSKTSQLSTPCLISLAFTTLFLITITILSFTPPDILPRILPPICPAQPPDQAQQTHGRIFTERPELERINADSDSDEVQTWESLLIPPSGGGIHSHTVPDSIHLNHSREGKILSWGISMFHQLHCLVALRALVFPETSESKINSTSGAHTGNMAHDRGH
ncbi:hypothetical protein BO94DRAFT_539591 [Aspergillus sclerotioniger CBS 115572]|uniref:Uncharacterized protein n=1 Tax=Aspergillus sclerotioniger CBS 115572 TaxID=1450535 RepID=A0A317VA09_9EURO|nr:hypothetical protein BO94DRAFT_539591 [Aspergillus sclerotioniger CBS 115572]PWY71056.1 hypothetical protein BO94DRAFT_539591 [Aspergillus sclerotioniger CBS 115572]